MIPCKALRPSSARVGRIAPTAACSKGSSRSRWYSHKGRLPRGINPSTPNTTERDDGPPLKIDSEKKTVDTAVGELPLSPVLDSSYWDALLRHKGPKLRAGKPQNSLERQFRKNPFAKALGTPVRFCAITHNRLPKFFLEKFSVVKHPNHEEGDQPWFVPRNLALRHHKLLEEQTDASSIAEALAEVEQDREASADSNTAETVADDGGNPPAAEPSVREEDAKTYGPSGYILARRDLFSALVDENIPRYFEGYRDLLLRSSESYGKISKRAVWRNDMDQFVLAQMRQDAVNDILYLSKLCADEQRHYIVKCYGWDDIQYKHKGSVLWFDHPVEDAARTLEPPGPFSMLEVKGTDVKGVDATSGLAVHNMHMLLGSEHAEHIKKTAAVLRDGAVFMLAGRRTVELQAKLWKLQGYIADYSAL